MRIRNNPVYIWRIDLYSQNGFKDIIDYRIKNNYFGNDIYFIIPENNKHNDDITIPDDPFNQRMKMQHHISNSKHTKAVALYKYLSYTPKPEVDVQAVFQHPILKVYIPEYDTFVYQSNNKLIWLIGANIEKDTEIIFHIFPDKAEALPPNRIQYGFDNRGFNSKDKSECVTMGKYRVFVKDIPTEYNISFVHVGFNNKKSIIKAKSFSLSQE